MVETTEFPIDGKYRRLIQGRICFCPRCKKPQDILQYQRLGLIEEFARDTTPIFKCPLCRWLFAPADDLVAYLLGRSSENGVS